MTSGGVKCNSDGRTNVDEVTVASFGDEWAHFDQSMLSDAERERRFGQYFSIFPWHILPQGPEGFDMGCGSGAGRSWSRHVWAG
jgi:hypothetical protein